MAEKTANDNEMDVPAADDEADAADTASAADEVTDEAVAITETAPDVDVEVETVVAEVVDEATGEVTEVVGDIVTVTETTVLEVVDAETGDITEVVDVVVTETETLVAEVVDADTGEDSVMVDQTVTTTETIVAEVMDPATGEDSVMVDQTVTTTETIVAEVMDPATGEVEEVADESVTVTETVIEAPAATMAELLAGAELSAEEAAAAAGERPDGDEAAAAEADEGRKPARRGRPRLKLEDLVLGAETRGRVVGVAEFGAFVDIGAVTDGLVHITELSQRRVRKAEEVVKLGDTVNVWIKDIDLEKGKVGLSMRPRNLRSAETLEKGETLTGTVTSLTQYGAFVDIGADTEGLVHVSEMSNKRIGKPEDVVSVGDTITVWVKEVDAANGRVSLSMRPRDMRSIDTLAKGEQLTGTVTSVTKYGAFVDIGAETEGLVHVSELSDHRVDRPEDVVKAGDSVAVWVKEVDVPAGRVSLSMRSRPSRPMSELKAGDVLDGTVSKVMDYGIFVNIGAETEGLVHVSEMGSGFVKNPRELVQPGDTVEVRIKEVDASRKRISLSMTGLRTDMGGEVAGPSAGRYEEDFNDYEPEPEERQPTAMELAMKKALGEDSEQAATDRAAESEAEEGTTNESGEPRPTKGGLSDVYSRMLEEYRQSKGE
jgi:predicted RNA-binding protein with RPS1 domain